MSSFAALVGPAAAAILARTLWDASAKVYRPCPWSIDAVQRVRLIPGEEDEAKQVYPGKKGPTPNYDTLSSEAGQSKENNILTSDTWQGPGGYDVGDHDVIDLGGAWFTIVGDPTEGSLMPTLYFFLTTTTPPKIVAGYWGE